MEKKLMHNFDHPLNSSENYFVKNNPTMLRRMFGTTNVVPLWIADMDFAVAKPITDEIKRLADRGVFAYEFPNRMVYKEICQWMRIKHGLNLKPRYFTLVPSVLAAIALLIRELTEKGDGVLIQPPVYHQFSHAIKASDRRVVENPLLVENDKYIIDFDDLEEKLQNEKVKIILFCNPHNPGGRVWSELEVTKMIALADKYNVYLISDEIHSDIVFYNKQFTSILSQNTSKHIALLGSPAKTFGLQGIASGYIIIPDDKLKSRIENTIEALYLGHGNALSLYSTMAAYQKGGAWLTDLLIYLEKTMAWVDEFVAQNIPKIKVMPNEATYQIWIDFRGLKLDKNKLEELIFLKAGLGLAPGSWFGKDGEGYYRMTIASPIETIQKAFYKLHEVIKDI